MFLKNIKHSVLYYVFLYLKVDGINGRSYTYTQLKALYTKCGSALTRKGFKKGDVLCIYSSNLPEYQIIVGAVLIIGGIVTTANPLSTVGTYPDIQ